MAKHPNKVKCDLLQLASNIAIIVVVFTINIYPYAMSPIPPTVEGIAEQIPWDILWHLLFPLVMCAVLCRWANAHIKVHFMRKAYGVKK